MEHQLDEENYILEPENLNKKGAFSRVIRVISILTVLAGSLYGYYYDLFQLPDSLQVNRGQFEKVFNNYKQNSQFWDEKKEEVMSLLAAHRSSGSIFKKAIELENLPLEVLLSYLIDEGGMELILSNGFSLYPKGVGSPSVLVLSKPHPIFGFLGSYISAEIEFKSHNEFTTVEVVNTLWGRKSVDVDEILNSFHNEIRALRPFSGTFSGTRKFRFSLNNEVNSLSASNFRVNVVYRQTSIGVGNF